MADGAAPTPVEGEKKSSTQVYLLSGLAVVALLCVTAMAVTFGFLFKGQPIQVNPTITGQTVGQAGHEQGLLNRPSEAPKPTPMPRSPAQDAKGPVLPGKLGNAAAGRDMAVRREDPPSPPYAKPGDLPAKKLFFRVRELPRSEYSGAKALPMPVRYSIDSQFRVQGVYAAYEPTAADKEKFSFLPDRAFEEVRSLGSRAELRLDSPRLTSQMDGYRAPKGFQFFTAHVTLRNLGDAEINVEVDGFEVHDFEGVRYLPLAELMMGGFPSEGLEHDKEAGFDISFLVPDASPLKEMALRADGSSLAVAALKER
jgi:hypothetical protein